MAAIIYISYLVVVPIEVMRPNRQPYRVMNENRMVGKGELLMYEVDMVKLFAAEATIVRSFVCGDNIFTLPAQETNIRAGKLKTRVSVKPPDAARGRCYLDLDFKYTLNIFRSKYYHLQTESFFIL